MHDTFTEPAARLGSRRILTLVALWALVPPAFGDISLGLFSDFEDNTLQGWEGGASPTNVTTGGPAGTNDNFLRIGNGGQLATFNMSSVYSGVIAADVDMVLVDMMRPASDTGSLDMRLVLFGPGTSNRWTSTTAHVVRNDGVWRTYAFSLREQDLTQVAGTGSYAALTVAVDRTMFRHDPGPPSATGTAVSGTLGLDNIEFFQDAIFADRFE